ncbi:uncharacterized protein LOC105445505 [Strongylocentrotus purpuratus]|uniref:Fibronectin type-III domain-containing protein n=1 Tax=Strongylocentrotus purpuratus TaxID=7668 RepID=A0A7M7PKH1_STRPU|nr:uncharacterized protein LOC105445505 [Strongylocentrotus purpuratus]
MDLASTQIRSAPEAPLEIKMSDIKSDSIKFILTPPTSPHDGYELYLSNSTTNKKSLVRSVPREDEMSYETTITDLYPATIYNVEVGTILNAEGAFPLQRSENNTMLTFETDDAVSHSPKVVMLLISLLAAVIMI